ncbi:MAG: hypothetical protein EOO38_15015 [Cytophagaceae bacterium]|nr:MAG: hypothetical protein EOO38_15015 [Cytophagaceae bacterium]
MRTRTGTWRLSLHSSNPLDPNNLCGTTIPTSVFQTLVNLIDFQLDPARAVNAPKFHHQWLPDVVYVERTFPVEIRRQLEAMGYRLEEKPSIGRVELIVVDASGRIKAVADGRGDDSAEGY